ncbi:MAG: 2-oxoglutarate dehydrogenase E1 component [Bacteroidia bacterium]|jgi:2-oxoglutarate dehydrogenase E1 component|nr:2-oxoglutarate dehydrogenase E1 component [Bacteroidia bacterium]MBP7727900.1 2-oxoglutarate dehydrogenase E1 component [Bacteroidia bacterium]MBP7771758.1 2-oxoglutarate dehydrogenase E1 component [Bacteroidia bacterium]
MDRFSFLSNLDVNQAEELYRQFLQQPDSLDAGWRNFLSGFEFARTNYDLDAGGSVVPKHLRKEFNVINLINGYRTRGHLFTDTNPVRERRKYTPTLDLVNFGLGEEDLDQEFQAGSLIGIGKARLRDIVQHLHQTYCASIGAEYKYIRNPEIVEWLEQRMEGRKNTPAFSIERKRRILEKLNEAVAFENFIHTKFVGQKRFSLEGCETLIPALDSVISSGADLGIREFVIGMAHRGRLNVLANILGKTYEEIFTEFEGLEYDEEGYAGDVKYHLGYSSDVTTPSGKSVHLSVAPNPSHLEAVDPVVQGIVRSKIDNTPGGHESQIAPILIHGDAAVAAQGVVYEVIQMSLLRGYRTGGTIHLVINNQIGFTTNYLDARSSTYCTDVAKVTLSPVFHVNADDVEALVYTIELAMEFRQKFHRDVFIDILGYRKYGHNEGDEPRFTQPLLYKAIAAHPNPREVYNDKLMSLGAVEADLAREMEKSFKASLQKSLDTAKQAKNKKVSPYLEGSWKGLRLATPKDFDRSPDTGVDIRKLKAIGAAITRLPEGNKFFNKTERLFAERAKMVESGRFDWAMAELLAYGTLLSEGHPVRFSGQDVERGTFSHRHAVVRVEDSEAQYVPLANIGKEQAPFHIYNSLLSEYAVLGFEYGYALASPFSLVIWEAQFGDFMNGAQIIIDQYLSSAEDKWNRMNGITLLLPHGYEGQGAEHSSARLERFLNLCAENNIQVANCTTPANFFHLLRRQMHRPFRKPLIVFTPKSLLRHPRCVSDIAELSTGGFQEVMDDTTAKPNEVARVIFCSGKVYYELLEQKEKDQVNDVAIVRLEQLYPLPLKQIEAVRKKYANATDWIWLQEEPVNMGAWSYILRVLRDIPFKVIAREESASPATGSHRTHEREQRELINRAFARDLVAH